MTMLRKLIAALCLSALLACPADAVTGTRRVLLSGNKVVLWSPLNASSIVAWWDPQLTSSITFNGSNVAAISDRKSGIVASQGTGANQPVWSATARNGKPGMSFNGTTQILTFSPALLPSGDNPLTIAIAGFLADAVNRYVFDYGANSGNQRLAINARVTSQLIAAFNGGDEITAVAWSTDRFVEVVYLSPNLNIYVDGNTPASFAIGVQNKVLTSGTIGGFLTGIALWSGVVQQTVILNASPSTNLRQCIEGWESWYDGKAGANLPGGHPYKLSAPLATSNCI